MKYIDDIKSLDEYNKKQDCFYYTQVCHTENFPLSVVISVVIGGYQQWLSQVISGYLRLLVVILRLSVVILRLSVVILRLSVVILRLPHPDDNRTFSVLDVLQSGACKDFIFCG